MQASNNAHTAKQEIRKIFINMVLLYQDKTVKDLIADAINDKVFDTSAEIIDNMYRNKLTEQRDMIERALNNLHELKPIMEYANTGDMLMMITECRRFIVCLDIAIKCLEYTIAVDSIN
jgi:hypothetical protein